MWDLITDNNSVEGKLVTTVVIVAIATVVGTVLGRVWSRRIDDRSRKYYARKIVHYVVVGVTLIGLGILWRPFAGQRGLVVGLMAAGIAIGLQDLIGSLAGWFNIQSGSIFRVGDRVDVGGVRGDVIDISQRPAGSTRARGVKSTSHRCVRRGGTTRTWPSHGGPVACGRPVPGTNPGSEFASGSRREHGTEDLGAADRGLRHQRVGRGHIGESRLQRLLEDGRSNDPSSFRHSQCTF